jgi:hypothetical protein
VILIRVFLFEKNSQAQKETIKDALYFECDDRKLKKIFPHFRALIHIIYKL